MAASFVKVDINPAEIAASQARFSALGKFGLQGQARAKNRTASFLRTQGSQRIRQRLKLSAKYVGDRITVVQATAADPAKAAVVRAKRRQMRMDRFPYRQITNAGKKAGIQVEIRPGHRERIASAFLVPLRAGKDGDSGSVGIAVRLAVLAKLGQTAVKNSLGGFGSRRYSVLHTSALADVFGDALDSSLSAEALTQYRSQLGKELQNAARRAQAGDKP